MGDLLEMARLPVPHGRLALLKRVHKEVGERRRELPLTYRLSKYTLHHDEDAPGGGWWEVDHPTHPLSAEQTRLEAAAGEGRTVARAQSEGREGASATMPSEATVPPPLFFSKTVRDLHWVMASPNLLTELAAAPVPDGWCAALCARSLPWLRELEAQPSELEEWLKRQRNVRRLGFYYAALLEYWVRFCPLLAVPKRVAGSPADVLVQQQIHAGVDGEVAGQLKLVFERKGAGAPIGTAEPAEGVERAEGTGLAAGMGPGCGCLGRRGGRGGEQGGCRGGGSRGCGHARFDGGGGPRALRRPVPW